MLISEMADEDREQVINLWGGSYSASAPNEASEFLATAREPYVSSILVGKKNGDVIAGAMVCYDGHRGWIYGVCVDKTFQSQGFGKAIVSEAEAWLSKRGASTIHLQMRFTSVAAIRFYDKLGYQFQDMVVLGKHI